MHGLILKTVGIVSLLVGLSSVAAIAGAMANTPTAWFALSFEAVVLLSAVFGVLTALGRFREGVPIAVLCVAGAVLVGSALGYLGADGRLLGVSLKPLLGARIAASAVLGVAASAAVLRHSMRGVSLLFRGMAVGVVPAVILAAYWKGVGGGQLASLSGSLSALVHLFGFLLVGGMLCASVHLVIRAFQIAAMAAREQSGEVCPKCRYPLRGLPVVDGVVKCSECGEESARSGSVPTQAAA